MARGSVAVSKTMPSHPPGFDRPDRVPIDHPAHDTAELAAAFGHLGLFERGGGFAYQFPQLFTATRRPIGGISLDGVPSAKEAGMFGGLSLGAPDRGGFLPLAQAPSASAAVQTGSHSGLPANLATSWSSFGRGIGFTAPAVSPARVAATQGAELVGQSVSLEIGHATVSNHEPMIGRSDALAVPEPFPELVVGAKLPSTPQSTVESPCQPPLPPSPPGFADDSPKCPSVDIACQLNPNAVEYVPPGKESVDGLQCQKQGEEREREGRIASQDVKGEPRMLNGLRAMRDVGGQESSDSTADSASETASIRSGSTASSKKGIRNRTLEPDVLDQLPDDLIFVVDPVIQESAAESSGQGILGLAAALSQDNLSCSGRWSQAPSMDGSSPSATRSSSPSTRKDSLPFETLPFPEWQDEQRPRQLRSPPLSDPAGSFAEASDTCLSRRQTDPTPLAGMLNQSWEASPHPPLRRNASEGRMARYGAAFRQRPGDSPPPIIGGFSVGARSLIREPFSGVGLEAGGPGLPVEVGQLRGFTSGRGLGFEHPRSWDTGLGLDVQVPVTPGERSHAPVLPRDNEHVGAAVDLLLKEFPGFGPGAVADVYMANGCDLARAMDVLAQLRLQDNVSRLPLPPRATRQRIHHAPDYPAADPAAAAFVPPHMGMPFAREVVPLPRMHPEMKAFQPMMDGRPGPHDPAGPSRKLPPPPHEMWPFEPDMPPGPPDFFHGRMNTPPGMHPNDIMYGGVRGMSRKPGPPPLWIDGIGPVHPLCRQLREEADEHARISSHCFEQATSAYMAGNKVIAKQLSSKGQWHNDRMKEAHAQADEEFFRHQNSPMGPGGRPLPPPLSHPPPPRVLDLHGLHLADALPLVKREVSTLRLQAVRSRQHQHMTIFIGTEHHMQTSRGTARLLMAVEHYLQEDERLQCMEVQPGLLRVTV